MESPLPPDPYKTLDVARDASLATIRSAHRKLVLKTHPDKVQGDEELKKQRGEQFHQIQQSYEILSDDARRKAYDDRVKLAALRAEMLADRGGSRILPDVRPSMSGRSPTVEVRGGHVYETRAPRRSYDDQPEDFFNHKPRDSRPSSKYEEVYTPSSSRKSSLRMQEDKRRARDIEEERDRRYDRGAAKAEKKSVFAERTRQRDRDRKKDYDLKYKPAYVEEDSDLSDSSDTEVNYRSRRDTPPKHRYEQTRKTDREDTPRRSSQRDVDDDDPSDGLEYKVDSANDYIRKSRAAVEIESRRPQAFKATSTRDIRPPVPPVTPSEHQRRSSGRTHGRRDISPQPKLSTKGRHLPEIVDAPETRKPAMPTLSSDPRSLRSVLSPPSRGKPGRASTTDHAPEFRSPGIRRAETMPINKPRHDDYTPAKSSKLNPIKSRNQSPESPAHSPQLKSTKYAIVEPADEDDEGPRRVNAVYVTPDDSYRRDRDRDISPRSRKFVERPSLSSRVGSSARIPMPPLRSTSYAVDDEDDFQNPPRLKRAETSHMSPLTSRQPTNSTPRQYFPDMLQTEEPYKIKHSSPKIGREDIRYGRGYDRRSSEDHRDWGPGSEFDSRRPSYGRSTSRVY